VALFALFSVDLFAGGTLTLPPVTLPGGANTPEMTCGWDSASGQISITPSITNGGSGSNTFVGHCQLMPGTDQAPFAGGYLFRRWAGNGGLDIGVSPVTGLTNGATYTLLICVTNSSNSVVGSVGVNIVPAAASYSITFTIPANPPAADGGTVVRYQVRNAEGDVISEYNSLPGDPETEITITGLESGEQLYLVRVEGQSVGFVDENGEYSTVFVPTGYTNISNGAPSSGSPPVVPAPSTPVPAPGPVPTPTPDAPEPTPAPSTPTATTPTTPRTRPGQPTPSGTGGATKADLETVGNQLDTAIRDGADDTVNASAKIVEAVDKTTAAVADGAAKTVVAVDKVSTAVWEAGKTVVAAVDTVRTGVGKTNDTLGLINDRLKTHGTKLDSLVTAVGELTEAVQTGPSREADEAAAAEATEAATTAGASAKTSSEGSLSSQGVPSIAPTNTGSGTLLQFTIPVLGSIDLDPTHDAQVMTVIEFFRTLLTWVVLLGFLWWLWAEFKSLAQTSLLLPQAKGNTIAAGTGGQATGLVAATAITAALLAVPAAFFALTSTGSDVAADVFATASGPVLIGVKLFYMIFPVEVIVTVLVSSFVVRKGGLIILLGVAAVIRFIVP